jgi:hypothetical protein
MPEVLNIQEQCCENLNILSHFILFCICPIKTVSYFMNHGARGGVVVKALRYKPEGRGIDSRWCQKFSLT